MTLRRWLRVGIVGTVLTPFSACSASDSGSQVGFGGSNQGGNNSFGGSSAAGGFNFDASGGSSTGGSSGTGPQPAFIDNCPGSLDPAQAQALQAGGTADPSMKWLYPYDKTVFPRGLIAPILQWVPAGNQPPTAIYVHLKSANFEYKGCFGATNPAGRLPIPQNVWDAASTLAGGAADPLNVELTTAAGGRISGPIKEVWAIAPATLKGAIFYNTYGSPQVAQNGAIMRLLPGQQQPQAFLFINGITPFGPCMNCHSLSANGQAMVAARHQYPGGPYQSFSYRLQPNSAPNPAPISQNTLDAAGLAAVYPDGSKFMTMGSPGATDPLQLFPMGTGNVVGMEGPRTSRLFAINGQALQATGWNVQYAKMPTFSPDGTKIVFNHHEAGQGHTLAVMDFNNATNAFSNYKKIFEDSARFPGWPFFTPDSKGVIFVNGQAPDYVSSFPLRIAAMPSDLMYVDVATGRAVPLARAGGFNGTASYLPYPGRDEHWEYFPTVSPVAAGGQFWLFFTSRRNYGNIIVGPTDDVKAKKIWVSAIDIDPPAGADPSHPAFYLPGQEEASGNVRAFAALEPCRGDGQPCSSGVDCCCGACQNGACGCPSGCSKIEEKCTTAADCCDPGIKCINGYCSPVVR